MIDTLKTLALKPFRAVRTAWRVIHLPLSAYDSYIASRRGVFSQMNGFVSCVAFWAMCQVAKAVFWFLAIGLSSIAILHLIGYPGY